MLSLLYARAFWGWDAAAWSSALQVFTASHAVSAAPVKPLILHLLDQRLLTPPTATKGLPLRGPRGLQLFLFLQEMATFALPGIGDAQGQLDVMEPQLR